MRLRWLKRVKKIKKRGGEHNFVVFHSLLKNITTAIQRQSLLAAGLLTRLVLAVSRRKRKRAGLLLAETKSTNGLFLQKKKKCVPPIAFGHEERKSCHVVICPHWCFWFKLWLSCSLSLCVSCVLCCLSPALSLPGRAFEQTSFMLLSSRQRDGDNNLN